MATMEGVELCKHFELQIHIWTVLIVTLFTKWKQ